MRKSLTPSFDHRGLGLEFARQYAADGWRVIACARRPAGAEELNALASDSAGPVTVHELDVDDHAAIDALSRQLAGQPIDLLLNNAGVMGRETFADKGLELKCAQLAVDVRIAWIEEQQGCKQRPLLLLVRRQFRLLEYGGVTLACQGARPPSGGAQDEVPSDLRLKGRVGRVDAIGCGGNPWRIGERFIDDGAIFRIAEAAQIADDD